MIHYNPLIKNNNTVDNTTENENDLLQLIDINNNDNSAADNIDGTNQSYQSLVVNNLSIKDTNSASNSSNENCFNKKKVNFERVSSYSPINIDRIGLRKSLRISILKEKELDLSLNYINYINTNRASEEERINQIKEIFSLKKQ